MPVFKPAQPDPADLYKHLPEGHPVIDDGKLAPYPHFDGHSLRDVLRGRRAEEFPSASVYPPPDGAKESKTQCGCLYTSWRESTSLITLETIWQPRWQKITISPGQREAHFFTNAAEDWDPVARYYKNTLNWPKRMHVWELELFLSGRSRPVRNMEVVFRIGEKDHLRAPLELFHVRSPHASNVARLFLPLPLPLYIRPVQSFTLSVVASPPHCLDVPLDILAVLHGYLSREIP